MAWLRRVVRVDVAAPPVEVAQRLLSGIRADGEPRLYGHGGAWGFALHSDWRPSLLRQRYPVEAAGTFTPGPYGTRVDAAVTVGFAVQFMLFGAAGVATAALWAGLTGRWPPVTAGLVVIVAGGHLYSVVANLRDAERRLRQALGAAAP